MADNASTDRQRKQPEAGQFDDYESFVCEVIIGEPEAMIVEVDLAGESGRKVAWRLGELPPHQPHPQGGQVHLVQPGGCSLPRPPTGLHFCSNPPPLPT